MPVVLLVRADIDTRAMYADYLSAHHFDVVEAESTDEGLQMAPTADLIVTGLKVPGSMSSLELIRRLKQEMTTKDRPIIVLTGSILETDHREAYAAGCSALLLTPCLPDVLLTEVRRLLDRQVAR
jgi:CheY-like chemotaxis protein